MNGYVILKFIHILSATVLFGTGLGTAFQMWMAHLSGDVRAIATVARNTVRADLYFTTPAVIIQPLTGIALIQVTGTDPFTSWLVAVYGFYLLTGLCWLPVVWLQWRARDLAVSASDSATALPPAYFRMMWLWFWLGWPAFLSVTAIVWLMVSKPELW